MLKFITVLLLFACIEVKPVRPVMPIGCRDIRVICLCDSTGQNCHWDWICVK